MFRFLALLSLMTIVAPVGAQSVLGGPDWSADGDQYAASFGHVVASAGDVDGDGYSDVIVGAPGYEDGGSGEGRVSVFAGSATGLSSLPAWTADSTAQGWEFGFSVAAAGDVDGDGYDDVIVGDRYYSNGQTSEGGAFVYLGSPVGLGATAAWTAESDQANAWFGHCVSTAGDVNGDGYDDVIVGAFSYADGQHQEGAAFVYLGSAGGLSTSAAWMAESNEAGALFGYSVATAGDVDGDGYDDVIVGAPAHDDHRGSASVYLGSASGLAASAAWTVESAEGWAFFGFPVASAGDIDGDGYGDVVVGAILYSSSGMVENGRAFAYMGSASGLSTSASWTADGSVTHAWFGESLATAGDVDGDGYSDVIAGTPQTQTDVGDGYASVYLGSAAGLASSATWTGVGPQHAMSFATSVSSAGDVDGDGHDDVIVGAPGAENGDAYEGRAFAFLGEDCGEQGTSYCAANPNSTGAPAEISAWCSSSAAAGELRIQVAPVPEQPGLFFHGSNQAQVPFGNGFLCTTVQVVRGAVTAGLLHVATYRYDNSDPKHALAGFAGTTRQFQYWFRDPLGGGALFNTSNALAVAIRP